MKWTANYGVTATLLIAVIKITSAHRNVSATLREGCAHQLKSIRNLRRD